MKWIVPKKVREQKRHQNKMTKAKVQVRMENGDNGRPDFLSNVPKQPIEKRMTEDELVSNSYVLIIAGSETTATLLSGATYYILTVPGVLDKLKAEIRTAFTSEDQITWSAVNQLKYTLAVLNEGLRMYPPVPYGFPRMVEGKGDFICGRWVPGGVS
jgi:cytochrome P450